MLDASVRTNTTGIGHAPSLGLQAPPQTHAQPNDSDLDACISDLYAKHYLNIVKVLYLKHTGFDWERAQELAQEAFARLWERRHTIGLLGNPRAWLFTVAINLARDYARHAKLLAFVPINDAIDVHHDEPDIATINDVREAVAKLPVSQQKALLLRWGDEVSHAEAIVLLQTTIGAYKARLFQAQRSLRQLLASEGYPPTSYRTRRTHSTKGS